MTKKVKLSDVARDLQIPTQELIGFYQERDEKGNTKKGVTGLTPEEINLALEYYSQKTQVDSLDAYFASKDKPKSKQEKKSGDKKPADKKPADKKNSDKKPAEKKAADKKLADKKPQPEKKAEEKKPAAPQAQKHEKPKKQQAKAQKHGERLHVEVEMASADSITTEKRRTVDTRGSYVDLDKYNQRYEQIAPASKYTNDRYSTKKQKINQKSAQRNKQRYSSKRETEQDKLRRLELERARKQQLRVRIPDVITVGELATRLKVTATEVIKKLMMLGVMATINEEIDFDTASLVAEELGAKVEHEVIVTIEDRLIDEDDDAEDTEERCPVVCVMGHVDHGKTSILDRIRNAHVTAGEAGGITQHIGAYQVRYEGKDITFLDTPGHEAFTAMRARGANITDIAILVVAADDGIMPQTVESINHAKAAGITVIVAINKMDKEGANPDRIKEELTKYGMVCEEWGGDVICVPVSAKTGEGIDDLLENILLVAETSELKANPDRRAKGTVVEARLDKGRGPIATLLVQNGTLHVGDVIIAGTAVGRVRVMTNDKGQAVESAGPSVPVEITGLAEVPEAGDTFNAVEDERLARELVEQRKHEAKQAKFNEYQKVTLDNLFSQIEQGEMKELSLIVKADVQGSVEAVTQSLEKLSNDEVRVRVIHGGVGGIKESDVMLASASNAIIIGFNVRPDQTAEEIAARDKVDIRTYRVIYDAIEEIETAMKGMLAPKFREVVMGRIEVRQVYKISNVGAVAGAYVLNGKVTRQCEIRVVRDGIVIAEDKMSSLKRFKDDVKEVGESYECGITLEKFRDFKEGDIFEAFIMEEYRD
ncbi:translation initiation factor IF-2 [uncultured Ruminococcus sp.]|jgi:translation initiation factor IF-2|uniref:translation initiation factor IF-2 n=1 Tax=uncultured Ruminococcus sp. TaxID=165186 RepID=UPI00259A6698|nr:translation initiation factor IF-2 [uncultured Ruminococcus sp.]